MADWRTDYFQLIDDCERRDERLSSWDQDFLASVKDRLNDHRPLTQKQIDKLDEIWEKATRNG